MKVFAPSHIKILDRQVPPDASSRASVALEKFNIANLALFNIIENLDDIRQPREREVVFSRKFGKFPFGSSPMEKFAYAKFAFGAALRVCGFSNLLKNIIVNFRDADGSIQIAFLFFSRLKDGYGFGLAGRDLNGPNFFRLKSQL